jgi:uncharacterized membrane protein HdeD (DUF308 family)
MVRAGTPPTRLAWPSTRNEEEEMTRPWLDARGSWLDGREAVREGSRFWWLFMLAGVCWLLVSLVVLRFDWLTVVAVAVLFGSIAITAGVLEIAAAAASRGGWRVLHAVLGAIFVVLGVIAFATPGGTFVGLAAVVSFFFVFAGTFDLVNGIATRRENDLWWLQIVAGAIQIGLGFWAAGNWSHSVALLVAWVCATTLFRGIAMIVFGFKLRELRAEPVEATAAAEAGREEPRPSPRPSFGR